MARLSQFKKSGTYPSSVSWRGRLERTTDLGAIAGRKVLVLLDEQNLTIAARNHGFMLPYNLLATRIRRAAKAAEFHIFIAASHDGKAGKKLERSGYTVHVKTIRRKQQPGGREHLDCNIDNLFSFWAGLQAAKTACEVVVLASGDYGLSGELATAIRHQHNQSALIVTLSLPGSTAFDLDARTNPDITANLEIGLDLLKPNGHSIRQLPAGLTGNAGRFSFNSPTNPLY